MKEFVDQFKKKRKKLGLTLSEVSEKTHVRKKYLKAIEEGNFDEVKGEVFLKGFIKIYANFLDLDTEEILSDYEAYRKKVLDESDQVEEKTLNEKLGKYFADSRDGFLGKAIIIVISALILGFAGFYAYNNLYLDDRLEEETEIEEEDISEEENDITEEDEELAETEEDDMVDEEDEELAETEEDDIAEEDEELLETEEDNMIDEQNGESLEIEEGIIEEENNELLDIEDEEMDEEDIDLEELADTEVESEEITANEEGEIEIEIVTLEETWYSVTVDDELVFEDFTEEEDRNTFQGSQIELVIGNAAGVEIIKEDEVLGPFGETGEVIHQEYIVE